MLERSLTAHMPLLSWRQPTQFYKHTLIFQESIMLNTGMKSVVWLNLAASLQSKVIKIWSVINCCIFITTWYDMLCDTICYDSCDTIYHVPSVLWHCWFGIRKSIRPVKNWVMKCWCGYLTGVRCRLFAYGPANATAFHLLPHSNPDWFYLSDTSLPRLSWKRGQ